MSGGVTVAAVVCVLIAHWRCHRQLWCESSSEYDFGRPLVDFFAGRWMEDWLEPGDATRRYCGGAVMVSASCGLSGHWGHGGTRGAQCGAGGLSGVMRGQEQAVGHTAARRSCAAGGAREGVRARGCAPARCQRWRALRGRRQQGSAGNNASAKSIKRHTHKPHTARRRALLKAVVAAGHFAAPHTHARAVHRAARWACCDPRKWRLQRGERAAECTLRLLMRGGGRGASVAEQRATKHDGEGTHVSSNCSSIRWLRLGGVSITGCSSVTYHLTPVGRC